MAMRLGDRRLGDIRSGARPGGAGRGASLPVAAALCLAPVAALALAPVAATAQVLCGKRADFLKHLDANHREAPTAMGLTSTGRVIEVLTSDTGSWTIIITGPDGKTCLVAAGEAWQTLGRTPPPPGEAS
jgi:hypothetical protein